MNVVVYTDASYDWNSKVAACGYLVLQKNFRLKHQIIMMSDIDHVFLAETFAVIYGLQYSFLLEEVKSITVFTEMDIIVEWSFPERLKKRKYMQELIKTVETIKEYGVEVIFKKVKAHSGQRWNNTVDKSVRYYLKKHLLQNGETKETIQANA